MPDPTPTPDTLRAAIERLTYAQDDGSEYEHVDGCGGEPTCPACWVESLRAALAASTAPTDRDEPCVHCGAPRDEHSNGRACIAAGYYGNVYTAPTDSPTAEQVYQAWHATTEEWGGCADRERIDRVLGLLASPAPTDSPDERLCNCGPGKHDDFDHAKWFPQCARPAAVTAPREDEPTDADRELIWGALGQAAGEWQRSADLGDISPVYAESARRIMERIKSGAWVPLTAAAPAVERPYASLTDEQMHGDWSKAEERYEDGCDSDTRDHEPYAPPAVERADEDGLWTPEQEQAFQSGLARGRREAVERATLPASMMQPVAYDDEADPAVERATPDPDTLAALIAKHIGTTNSRYLARALIAAGATLNETATTPTQEDAK